MTNGKRCLTMIKGRHRFVFWYSDGRESDLLATFIELAADLDCPFDWYDAAVLSYQMGKHGDANINALVC